MSRFLTRTFFVVCISLVISTGLDAQTILIQPSSITVQSGSSFSVDVGITNVSDLFAFQFDLAFNPAIVNGTSTLEGSFLPTGGATFFIPGVIDNNAGTISSTADTLLGSVPGVTGSGVLATLIFDAKSSGTSPLVLSNILLLDSNLNSISFSTINGNAVVIPVPEPGSLAFLAGLGVSFLFAYRRLRRRKK